MLTVAFKGTFFDRQAVTAALDRGKLRGLSRFGSFVRTRDRSSLKYATKSRRTSAPGKPPLVHRSGQFTRKKTGKKQASSPLRDLTFFSYDRHAESVVIGPAVFRGKKGSSARTIEEGGDGHLARPHTGPAFRAELPRAAECFKNMVR